ncbi:C2 [Seminavis robusta]|uniref:C2 n=1 Tax=Seminavis robusta TaxID=568900 RepID=A0A9N8HCJ1_9STRA|nr:C2 [Seminavis robusta]|eukprot:Sro412_g137780.1 C2 (515) ;mRNA; r:8673-10217
MDHSHSQYDGSAESSTYEATMARKSTFRLPDPIHWSPEMAFRDQPYRHLHHQKGLMGIVRVRLLEAADLERSYWSALALGPVKHLGLSTAHGPISSFCTFTMEAESHNQENEGLTAQNNEDAKMPAKPSANAKMMEKTLSQPVVASPVIPQDNNPVWSDFHFEMPLRKGSFREDGMRIMLSVRVDEDAHVAEKLIPGIPKGDDRLIGRGKVDITSLCLGETMFGETQVGVLDAWVPVYYTVDDQEELEGQQQQHHQQQHHHLHNQFALAPPAAAAATASKPSKEDPLKNPTPSKKTPTRKQVGKVRLLITYRPNGMEPQHNDVVALESYARRPPKRSTCYPILPPLMPMIVREVKDPYLLVEYSLPVANITSSRQGGDNNHNQHMGEELRRDNKACMRIHRNSVFVIERKNFVDATVGLALMPADAIMSTPLGQTGAQVLGPILNAGRELLMPATLSFKLAFMALRTTTMVSLSGVQAAGGAIIHQAASPWANQSEESQYEQERNRARAKLAHL